MEFIIDFQKYALVKEFLTYQKSEESNTQRYAFLGVVNSVPYKTFQMESLNSQRIPYVCTLNPREKNEIPLEHRTFKKFALHMRYKLKNSNIIRFPYKNIPPYKEQFKIYVLYFIFLLQNINVQDKSMYDHIRQYPSFFEDTPSEFVRTTISDQSIKIMFNRIFDTLSVAIVSHDIELMESLVTRDYIKNSIESIALNSQICIAAAKNIYPRPMDSTQESNLVNDVINIIGRMGGRTAANAAAAAARNAAARNAAARNAAARNVIDQFSKEEDVWKSIRIQELLDIYDDVKDNVNVKEKLADFFTKKHLFELYSLPKETPNSIKEILNKCTTCTGIFEKDSPGDPLSTKFLDYTLGELGDFINLGEGACLTFEHLAVNIVMNPLSVAKHYELFLKGANLTQLTMGIEYKVREDINLARNIARYILEEYNTSSIFFRINNDKDSWKDLVTKYKGANKANAVNILEYAVKKLQSEGFISQLYTNLIKTYEKFPLLHVLFLYFASSNTLYELIGLLGYTLVSDSINEAGNNANGQYFKISQKCLEHFMKLLTKLKTIKFTNVGIYDNQDINLLDILYNISFTVNNNTYTIQRIMKEVESTCIHGIGLKFLQFYLSCYESVQKNISLLKNHQRLQISKLVPIPDNSVNDKIEGFLQLIPCVYKTPEHIELNTHIKYLICVPFDGEVEASLRQRKNPFKRSYLVSGFTSELNFYHLMTISVNSLTNNMTPDICTMLSQTSPHMWSIKKYPSYPSNYVQYLEDHFRTLYQIRRMPILFQSNRVQRFKGMCEFAESMCKMMNNYNDNYQDVIDFINSEKFLNIMTLEEETIIPKYAILLHYDKEEHIKSKYKHNNVRRIRQDDNYEKDKNVSKEKEFYMIGLEEFANLPYSTSVDANGNMIAIVKSPKTLTNVTNEYHYYRLINECFQQTTHNVTKIDMLSKMLEQRKGALSFIEQYFTSLTNHQMQLRSVFSNFMDPWKEYPDMNNDLEQFKNISFESCYEYISTDHPRCDKIRQRIKFIYMMYILYYYFVVEHTDEWHRRVKPFLFHNNNQNWHMFHHAAVKRMIESNDKDTYKTMINMLAMDLTFQLGGEGIFSNTQMFNFTDLEKEVYLVDQLKRYIGAGIDEDTLSSYVSTNNETEIIRVIEGLNAIFSGIYQDEPLSTDPSDILFTNESKPLAINYIAKMVLISKHRNRMLLYTCFENIIMFFTRRNQKNSFVLQKHERFHLIKNTDTNDDVLVNEDVLYNILKRAMLNYIDFYNYDHSYYNTTQPLFANFFNDLNDKIYQA